MDKFTYIIGCAVLALVLGGSWGVFIWWFHEIAGISIGLSLFLFCFVILVNMDKEEDEPQHNRRFNDL